MFAVPAQLPLLLGATAASASPIQPTTDATDPSKPHAPVGHSVVLALMVVELALAFAVGLGCLVTSILMMRKLRRERDAPLFFPQRRLTERQPSVASLPPSQQQQEQQQGLLSDDPTALGNQASGETVLMPDNGEPSVGIIGYVASSVTRIPGLRWLRRERGPSTET